MHLAQIISDPLATSFSSARGYHLTDSYSLYHRLVLDHNRLRARYAHDHSPRLARMINRRVDILNKRYHSNVKRVQSTFSEAVVLQTGINHIELNVSCETY